MTQQNTALGYLQEAAQRLATNRESYEEWTADYREMTVALGYLNAAINTAWAKAYGQLQV